MHYEDHGSVVLITSESNRCHCRHNLQILKLDMGGGELKPSPIGEHIEYMQSSVVIMYSPQRGLRHL